MAGTIVLPCNCKSIFQDNLYGNQKRLCNHAPSKGAKNNRYRCTVCKQEKTI